MSFIFTPPRYLCCMLFPICLPPHSLSTLWSRELIMWLSSHCKPCTSCFHNIVLNKANIWRTNILIWERKGLRGVCSSAKRENFCWNYFFGLLMWWCHLVVEYMQCSVTSTTSSYSVQALFITHNSNLMIIPACLPVNCEKKHLKAGRLYSSRAQVFYRLSHTLFLFFSHH